MAKHGLVGANGAPFKASVVDHAVELWREAYAVAVGCAKLEADKLTNAQKWAICALAGAAMRFDQKTGQLETAHPCSVVRERGKFVVRESSPLPPVREVKGGGLWVRPHLFAPLFEKLEHLCEAENSWPTRREIESVVVMLRQILDLQDPHPSSSNGSTSEKSSKLSETELGRTLDDLKAVEKEWKEGKLK